MHYIDPVFIIQTLGVLGVASVIFAESGLFFGFFLPGDSLLFTAGLLASKGYLHLISLLIVTFLAAVLGDNVGYLFGKKVGPGLFKKEDSVIFKKSHLEKTQKFFDKHGKKALILARFMPIVRTFTPILAGVGNMEYKTFFAYNLIGGFVWTFGLILLGYFLGTLIPSIDTYLTPIILGIVVISFVPALLEFIKSKKNEKRS